LVLYANFWFSRTYNYQAICDLKKKDVGFILENRPLSIFYFPLKRKMLFKEKRERTVSGLCLQADKFLSYSEDVVS
jgi:hypothetical protein